jgi:iron(III) transport system substrate-binding protein
LLGEQAQTYFAEQTFEYPVAAGIEPAAGVPPASFGDVGSVDFDELGGGLAGTREIIVAAGLSG